MTYRNFVKIFLVFLFVLPVLNGVGQITVPSNRGFSDNWQINYNLGFTEFYGDASNNGYFKKFSGELAFATGITVRKYFNPAFGLGINLWYSGIKSHKEKGATGVPTNFILTGKYFDGNVNLLVDFNSLFWGTSSRKLSVYGTAGLGYATWNSKLVDSITGTTTNSGDAIGTGSYKKGGFVVPLGLGLNYMLGNSWALNFEMNLRTVINDDVDVWRDGFKYDQLLYTSIGVSYFINRKTKDKSQRAEKKVVCPEEPIKPIPLYDYQVRPNSQKKSSNINSGIILIDVPVQKKIDVPSGIAYRVQIFAKRNKLPSYNYLRERFNIADDIYENYQDSVYRYSTGSFSTYRDALRHSYLMKDKGVHDAFVVAYKNDRRISISNEMKK